MKKSEEQTGLLLRLTRDKHYRFKLWCLLHGTNVTTQLNKMIDKLLKK